MLQVFYLDVAYVALDIHVCCKYMFQLFQTYVASVLSRCCICCTSYKRMLQVYVLNVSLVSIVCCKCFIWMLHMLQCPYTYVASVCCNYFIYFGCMLRQMFFTLQVLYQQARLGGAGRGGPLGRNSPRVHKNGRGARSWARSTKLHACSVALSLSLFQLDAAGQ
jgi:hypothetical protein